MVGVQPEGHLARLLERIDGRGYRAYKELRGAYPLGAGTLFVDHVQGDPFAAPSRLRFRVPMERAALPVELRDRRSRRIALADALAREGAAAARSPGRPGRGSGGSGQVAIDAGGQEILERSAAAVTDDWVELRLFVGLPAAGRRVLGGEARRLLTEALPRLAERALCWERLPQDAIRRHVECAENHRHLTGQLEERSLVAFVADGARLPRESGASDRPLPGDALVPWEGPASLAVELELAHPPGATVRGTGIPEGVTLIVGGGYHGKSTLLNALERGVYPHLPGDGRELVVTRADAVKIRAEDGRRVEGVDISAFIRELPGGRSTRAFRTEDASGSTSQAANIVEALEAGSRLLMLDEDTSATNFMVRDARMQALIAKDDEPITPFVDRVRELYEALGVSSVLVMGGSGDYFEAASTVLALREFRPSECSAEARAIAASHPTGRAVECDAPLALPAPRHPLAASVDASRGRRPAKIDAKGRELLVFGEERVELRGLEQLVDPSQTRAIGWLLAEAARELLPQRPALDQLLDALESRLDERSLDGLGPGRSGEHPGALARPRRYELAAVLNRLRSLVVNSV